MPATVLRRVPSRDLAPPLREAWQKSMELRGDATFFEVLGHHPGLYRWYTKAFYGELFHAGRVERRTKELARLALSLRHGCRFCNQGNRPDAASAGLLPEELAALEEGRWEAFSPKDQAVLALVEQMQLGNPAGRVDDRCYALLSPHFDDGEILELGMVLGVLCGMAKFLFAFDLVEKEAACPF